MLANQFCFGEYVQGIRNRNRLEQLPDMPDCYGRQVEDAYTSVYRFDNQLREHQKRTGSVSGFSGPCRATGLHFDFDSPHDDCSLKETNKFIETVLSCDKYTLTIENVDVYFSGNKGFHVLIRNEDVQSLPPSEKIPEQVKKLCTALAGGYTTFDRSVYDKTRLLRLINSRHLKSGLYKIPLYPAEIRILDLVEIRELAKHQRHLSDTATIHNFMRRCGHVIA
jgi:hypothetical protein